MKHKHQFIRRLNLAISIFLLLSIVLFAFTGCFDCKHKKMEESIIQEATCGSNGVLLIKCKNCEYSTRESIPATENHVYGGWVQSSNTSMYRTCVNCGAVESSAISGSDSGAASDTYEYTTFSSFESDCLKKSNGLIYNGTHNKISISLGGGNYTNTCENKHLIIPAHITDIQFIGITSGSPFSNFTMELEERVNNINIIFNDVRIEANSTIITSLSRYININITMLGQKCSFENIGKGYDGADGIDGPTNDDPDVYGSAGDNGTPAFKLNGTVIIFSKVAQLDIKGGTGGNGGDGGHIVTSSAPHGGNGGDGGNAILGEELATVYVAPQCFANIQGGAGGSGGAPGKSEIGYFGKNRTGNRGADGATGISGCNIIYQ